MVYRHAHARLHAGRGTEEGSGIFREHAQVPSGVGGSGEFGETRVQIALRPGVGPALRLSARKSEGHRMKSHLAKKKIGDEALADRTGKTWREWLKILDAAGARKMDHKGIVAVLSKRYGPERGWWWQMI